MKALLFERKVARYAAAVAADRFGSRRGTKVGPLSLRDIDPPELPAPEWVRVRPRLAGICGSDLATLHGHSSRYFEPIVSFPFVPGHEVVGDIVTAAGELGGRVALVPTHSCAVRGVDPPCPPCTSGEPNLCERLAFGHLEPGLQTGFCESTGGGWGIELVAHPTQLVEVPESLSDEDAVLIEPMACAVHAARTMQPGAAAIIGAGAIGLLTIAAYRALHPDGGPLVVAAKHPAQQRLAAELGADRVVAPSELARAVRSASGSWMIDGDRLTGGVPQVADCIGSSDSVSQALAITAPGGTMLLVGMPGPTTASDLTPLWHRELNLRGCYAYTPGDFSAAIELCGRLRLGRLVSATYPLDRFADAITHAAEAGARGAVKIAFDLRDERERKR